MAVRAFLPFHKAATVECLRFGKGFFLTEGYWRKGGKLRQASRGKRLVPGPQPYWITVAANLAHSMETEQEMYGSFHYEGEKKITQLCLRSKSNVPAMPFSVYTMQYTILLNVRQ